MNQHVKDNSQRRRAMVESLLVKCGESDLKVPVEDRIINTAVYIQLRELISGHHVVSEDNLIWGNIESTVGDTFKSNLYMLTNGNLSKAEFHTALLVKCGIKPSEICVLLGRTKGAISCRRETISRKIFGFNIGARALDAVIRML